MATKSLPCWQYLSPLDSFIPSQFIHQLLCFPSTGPAGVAALERAFARTLKTFPGLSATVVRTGKSLRLAGPFYEAGQMLTVRSHRDVDYLDLKRSRFATQLLDRDIFYPDKVSQPAPIPTPALRAQATLVSNGLLVGLKMHHALGDLGAYTAFLQALAHHSKTAAPQLEPQQSLLDRRQIPGTTGGSLASPPDLHQAQPQPAATELPKSHPVRPEPEPRIESAMYVIPQDSLSRLKVQLPSHLETGSETPSRLSTNDIVSALIWSGLTSALVDQGIYPENDTQVAMGMSVDFRRRLEPPLPPRFFGNALAMAWPTVARSTLVDAASRASLSALAQVALAVRQSHRHIDQAYVENFMAYLNSHEDPSTLIWGPGLPTTNMVIANWLSNDVCSLDWGQDLGPCEAAQTSLPFPHTVGILPRRPGSDAVEVAVKLTDSTNDMLKQNTLLNQVGFWA